jgi:Nicotinate-nucleotide pyrophosphorylase
VSKIILNKNFIRNICKLALNEDLYPEGDITSELLSNNINKKIKIISNQNGIIGGLEFAKQTFNLIDKKIKFKNKKKEGSKIKKGDVIAIIDGNIKNILSGERVALNFLSHISGVATKTNMFLKLINSKCKICCTRKTIPNIRVIQKYAVKLGGGTNHRFNLSDEFLIKIIT